MSTILIYRFFLSLIIFNCEQLMKVTLHELHHAQGGGFACIPGVSKKTVHNVNRDKKRNLVMVLN